MISLPCLEAAAPPEAGGQPPTHTPPLHQLLLLKGLKGLGSLPECVWKGAGEFCSCQSPLLPKRTLMA